MNPLQKEQKSVSEQVDTIMKNRFRRFKHLMAKERVEDAVAIGEEFTEWMMDMESEEILYFNENELIEMLNGSKN